MEQHIIWTETTSPRPRKESLRFVRELGTELPIGGRKTRVHMSELSFYAPGGHLVRVRDERWPETLVIYLVWCKDRLYWLNGESPPIHNANAICPITVTPENALSYLRFFCFFVRGGGGPFYILSGRSDPHWPSYLPTEAQDRLEHACTMVAERGVMVHERGHRIDAVLQYDDTFFEAEFLILPTGMVEMEEDYPIKIEGGVLLDLPIVPAGRRSPRRGRFEPTDTRRADRRPGSDRPAKLDRRSFIRLVGDLDIPIEGPLRADMERYRCLQPPVSFVSAPNPETFARALAEQAPHMGEVRRTVANCLRISHLIGDGRLKLPPLLVVGPTGCGKSLLTHILCKLFGVPYLIINGGGTSDNRFLCGTSRGWSTAEPSAPVRLLAKAGVANPAMIFEEIDKAGGSDRNGNPLASLLTMIEPTTAREWMDEYLATPVDISHINWIMTANDTRGLPEALLSRLTVLHVPAPTADQMALLLDRVVEDVVTAYGGAPASVRLPDRDRALLLERVARGSLGLRDLRRAVMVCLANPSPLGLLN